MNDIHTRPVLMSDLEKFRQLCGLTVVDLTWLLGIAFGHWGRIQRDMRLRPGCLAEPIHGLLIRWLLDHPGETPSLYGPDAGSFLRRLQSAANNVTACWFSLVLGWDSSAGHRWLRHHHPIGPSGRRALALLDADDPRIMVDNWRRWCDAALLEARLRGIDLPASKGWSRSVPLKQEAVS